jgi:hypothetical protein
MTEIAIAWVAGVLALALAYSFGFHRGASARERAIVDAIAHEHARSTPPPPKGA